MSRWLLFASVIMFVAGVHNIIYGIAALRDYAVVVTNLGGTSGANVIYANTTFWGWLCIAIGIAEVFIAAGIAARNLIARWLGIGIAAVNAIGQLAFLAAFPAWSVVIIAIDVLVIYGLTRTFEEAPGWAPQPYPDDRERLERRAEAEAETRRMASTARPEGTTGRPEGTTGRPAGSTTGRAGSTGTYRPPPPTP
jgi:hypothetical protein